MLEMTRREILKGLSAVSAGGLLSMASISNIVFAATPARNPILVVVHLRGGCDGLNFISPASDPDFIAARISELRVDSEGQNAGYSLANGPASNIDFRLHASAGGLNELYKNGNLAFIHACGLTNQTRSHFVATDMMDRGVATDNDLGRVTSGWLTRGLTAKGVSPGSIPAVSATGNMTGDLAEMRDAMVIPDLAYGLSPAGGAPISNAIWQLYENQPGEVAASGRMAMQMMADVDVRIARDAQGHIPPYQAANGANYDPAAELARALKTTAMLIKMDMGVQAITLDYGNWDTHEYQAGRFKPQVEKLSNGLAAFWNDLSAYHDRLVVVTTTEFGRRLRNNKSNGTDHGRAGVMTVIGGRVVGGRFHGAWPGLKTEQLDEGVDLAVTTDYRQVLTEIMNHHMGVPGNQWFPDYKPTGTLGLFA